MFGFGKPKAGENIVTKGKVVIHTFNPFKDETTTRTKKPVEIKLEKGSHKCQLFFERFQKSEEDSSFDVVRLICYTDQGKKGGRIDVSRFQEIIFNIDMSQNYSYQEVWKEWPSGSTNRNCFIINSLEEFKEIINAGQLEVRIGTVASNINLSNREEKKLQILGKAFYDEVYA